MFINLQAIFINLESAVWKKAHQRFGLRLLDFFFFRNLCYVLICSAFLYSKNQNPFSSKDFPSDRSRNYWMGLIIIRSITGHLVFGLLNIGFILTPISLAFIVFNTNPFWSSIAGMLINKEVIERFEFIGMILAFGGVCAMTYTAVQEKKKASIEEDQKSNTMLFGMLITLCAAFSFSIVVTSSRRLNSVSPFIVIFLFGLSGLILSVFLIAA